MSKERTSNFEMLRIFSMILIIMFHYCSQLQYETGTMANRLIYCIFGQMGGVGVDLFIFISAWFLCEKGAKFSIQKELDLAVITIVYSLFWWLGTCMIGDGVLSVKWGGKIFLTPVIGSYWFLTTYLLFYLICPLLNRLVNCLGNKQLRNAVLILTVAIPCYHTAIGGENFAYGVISTFSYIFILISYLKRNKENFIERHAVLIAVVDTIFMLASSFVLHEIGLTGAVEHIMDRSTVFSILLSASVFYCFKNGIKHNSKIVNGVAASMFGVYILHQYPWGSQIIWKLFHIHEAYRTPAWFINLLMVTTIIFVSCVVIDKIWSAIWSEIKRTKISCLIRQSITKLDVKFFDFDEGM